MVGVNGVGKTTTLGKLANLAVRSGYSCLVAAGDTFRRQPFSNCRYGRIAAACPWWPTFGEC